MTFQSLGLKEALIRSIDDQGYDKPTAIQARAIPARFLKVGKGTPTS
jgi:superfamily II DNA/RNA helicase